MPNMFWTPDLSDDAKRPPALVAEATIGEVAVSGDAGESEGDWKGIGMGCCIIIVFTEFTIIVVCIPRDGH